MIAASVAALLSWTLAASSAPPLGVARLAPSDVDAVIQVRGGLQGDAAGSRMLRDATAMLVDALGATTAWRSAASGLHMTPEALLQRCAGRDASLVVRRGAAGPEWVLALEMPGSEACDLLKEAGGRMGGSRRFEIPRFGVVGSWHGDWLLLTDDARSPLLRQMIEIGSGSGEGSLAAALPEDMRPSDDAAVTLAMRHERGAAGRSVWSITPDARGLHLDVQASLESDPFGVVVDGAEPELVPEAMPEETLACWMQRRPVHPVPLSWSTWQAAWVPSRAVLQTLGGRMAVLVGPGADGAMAMAVAYEVSDPKAATEAQDAMLERVVRSLSSGKAAGLPARSACRLESPRDLQATGLATAVFGGVEPLGEPGLHARTVCLPEGGWRVYASDRGWLDRVVASLEEHPSAVTRDAGPPAWTHAGFMQGAPLGRALQAWSERRAAEGRCGDALRLLSGWARLVDVASWRVAQTSQGRVHVVIDASPCTGRSEEPKSTLAGLP